MKTYFTRKRILWSICVVLYPFMMILVGRQFENGDDKVGVGLLLGGLWWLVIDPLLTERDGD